MGGSLHAGHHQEQLVDWVTSHRAALADRPSAFFSVSLTAADDTDEAREATQRCIDDFLAETGWTPARSVALARGAQAQRKPATAAGRVSGLSGSSADSSGML